MTFAVTRTEVGPDAISRRGVIHIRAESQSILTHMFVRLQEFYESPTDSIRGHYFTLDQLWAVYVPCHGCDRGTGKFTYYTDWHGYNIPGAVIARFAELFPDKTADEQMLIDLAAEYDWCYLIGSHEGGNPDEDALDHELVHATYFLDDDYRIAVNRQLEMLRTDVPIIYNALAALLKHWGYCEDVLLDEMNAYLATTDEAWWGGKTGDGFFSRALWNEGQAF